MRHRSLYASLFATVTWPHWAEHRLRSGLTTVGVALGVATVIAVGEVNESVLASFHSMVQTVAGGSELEVTSPSGAVDERLIDTAAQTEGVRAAAGIVETFVPLTDHPGEDLYVLGIDFLGSPLWQSQFPQEAIAIADKDAFLAQIDSVLLTRQLAQRLGLDEGGMLRVTAPGGVQSLTVRGMLGDVPPARLFDGAVAVMDLPAAQRFLTREGHVDRIAIQLAAGARVEEVQQRLERVLGPGLEVGAAEARGQQAEKLLLSLRSMLIVTSALAVIVGSLIVYQTVAVSVRQRRRTLALLNTVGIRHRTLITLCLFETTLLAVPGLILGYLAGHGLAAIGTAIVGTAASEIWLHVDATQRASSSAGTATGLLAGLATALLSAYVAARATLRGPTVEALRPAGTEGGEPRLHWLSLLTGLGLVLAAWLIILVPPDLSLSSIVTAIVATDCLAYLGIALLAPSIVLLVGLALRPLGRHLWLPARLAVDNLPRSPTHTGSTVATIAVAMAMAVIVAGLVRSLESAWVTWIEQHFAADLYVGSGGRVRLIAGPPMAEEIGLALRAIPGVQSVEPFRQFQIRLGEQPIFLQGLAVDERLAHGGVPLAAGDFATAAVALRAGTGALVSQNLAYRLDLDPGDHIELATPKGVRQFEIVGVFVDYLGALDLGSVTIARSEMTALWGDRLANLFRIWIEPGASPSAVRSAILTHLGGQGYFVISAGQFLEGVRLVLQRLFLATWALQVVAALVAVIGVVNAQVATVLDRSVEIAMLRTIGVAEQDLRRSVLLECGIIGALGALVGLALGAMLAVHFVWFGFRLVTGWQLPVDLPAGPLVAGLISATLISALAGWIPARAAAALETRQRSID